MWNTAFAALEWFFSELYDLYKSLFIGSSSLLAILGIGWVITKILFYFMYRKNVEDFRS